MEHKNEITYRKLPGITAQGIRVWGLLFLMCGIIGTSIFENVLVTKESSIGLISAGLALKIIHFGGIPVFAFLLVEGFTHTVSLRNYATRIAGLALLSELPFNLAFDGNVLGALSFRGGLQFSYDNFSLNPVFGVLLCLVILHLFTRVPWTGIKGIALKGLIWAMSLVWVEMLHIQYANAMILLVPVLYFLRNKGVWRVFGGCTMMFIACIFDYYYIGAPLAFLLVHFYNEEPGEGNRYINYLAYPVMLLAIGLVAKLAF